MSPLLLTYPIHPYVCICIHEYRYRACLKTLNAHTLAIVKEARALHRRVQEQEQQKKKQQRRQEEEKEEVKDAVVEGEEEEEEVQQ